MVLKHAGYRNLDNTELRNVITSVFDELEAKGIDKIKLQPFVQVCDSLSRALYNRPLRTLSLRDLEAMGLETSCGLVKRRTKPDYTIYGSSKRKK